MITSQDQDAGQNHNMRIYSQSFERMEQFKYLGTILINQNSMREEIKSKLKSEIAGYYLVQNTSILSSLLSKNMKNKMYRTIILFLVF
jgi:preprotein translocase subunit SecF